MQKIIPLRDRSSLFPLSALSEIPQSSSLDSSELQNVRSAMSEQKNHWQNPSPSQFHSGLDRLPEETLPGQHLMHVVRPLPRISAHDIES